VCVHSINGFHQHDGGSRGHDRGVGGRGPAILANFFGWYTVPGWSSLTVMISVIGGTTLMSIGVLGEYVGKMYEQIKNRPLYVVSRLINIQPAKRNEPESRVEALKKQ